VTLVVMLAKELSPSNETGVAAIGAAQALAGVNIAALVLGPAGFAALSAAKQPGADEPQSGDWLVLAAIGLTIPAVAIRRVDRGVRPCSSPTFPEAVRNRTARRAAFTVC